MPLDRVQFGRMRIEAMWAVTFLCAVLCAILTSCGEDETQVGEAPAGAETRRTGADTGEISSEPDPEAKGERVRDGELDSRPTMEQARGPEAQQAPESPSESAQQPEAGPEGGQDRESGDGLPPVAEIAAGTGLPAADESEPGSEPPQQTESDQEQASDEAAIDELSEEAATALVLEFEGEALELRRAFRFAEARERLASIAPQVGSHAGPARRLAAIATPLLAEREVFEIFVRFARDQDEQHSALVWASDESTTLHAPTESGFHLGREGVYVAHRWHEVPIDLVLAAMARTTFSPDRRLEFAQFAHFRGGLELAVDQVRLALEEDSTRKERADPMLAEFFGEDLPPGGYAWLGDGFLPFEEVNRRRFLADVVARCATALSERSPLQGLDALSMPLDEVLQLEPRLAMATDFSVDHLSSQYEPIRDWLSSYRRSRAHRQQRTTALEQWREAAEEARGLIARYDKPQQREVNEFRDRVADLHLRYERTRAGDELRLRRVPAADARALLEDIRAHESALDALLRYRAQYHRAPEPPFAEISPEGSRVHVLPGRKGAGLEDVWYALLIWRAGHIVKFLERAEQLLAAGDSLTPWEQMVLFDFVSDAIDEYNEHVLTSASAQERACMAATNRYRRTLRLQPFEIDERVVSCARGHSREMKRLEYFAHRSPVAGRHSPGDRLKQAGYQGGGGENIYRGGAGSTGEGAFQGWYHSPGHHRGMVSGNRHIGVGTSDDRSLYTMNFASGDVAWRLHWRDLDENTRTAIDDSIALLERKQRIDETFRSLLDRSGEALPQIARRLVALRAARTSEQRVAAALLARLCSLIATAEDIQPLADLGVETLITMLDDSAVGVRQEAVLALRMLAERKQGYSPHQDGERRRTTIERWERWWQTARADFSPSPDFTEADVAKLVDGEPERARLDRQSPDAPIKVLTPAERLSVARRLGGSKLTERCIELSLEWFAEHQWENGGWYGRRSLSLSDGEGLYRPASQDFEVGMTGLVLLCFLNGGHTVEIGRYRDVVQKAVDFLRSRLEDSGKFSALGGYYMYQHALATQALVEAYGTSGDPFLREAAQRALDYLIFAQNPTTGGWRYDARRDSDSSASGWQVLALASAMKAGLRVAGLRAAREYFDSVTEPSYYRVGYKSPTDSHSRGVRLTAVGMVARQVLGTSRVDPQLLMGTRYCLEELPQVERLDVYYAYYATLALFQMGGENWKRWNEAMVESLTKRICLDKRSAAYGVYPFEGRYDGYGGTLYSTALCTLMLEVYYRYDEFPEVRMLATTGSIRDAIQPFLDDLLAPDGEVDRAITKRLIEERFGSGAQAPMLNLLRTHDDLRVRRDAAEVLGRVATSSVLSDLLDLVDQEDAAIRTHVLRGLSRCASPAAIPALAARLADERRDVRGHAARVLAEIGKPQVVGDLLKQLDQEQDSWVRGQIQHAIERLASTRALHLVFADAGFGPDQSARRADIAIGLEMVEREGLIETIAGCKQTQPGLYQRALEEIKRFGRQSSIPLLVVALELDDAGARERAVKLLRALTGKRFDFVADAPARERKEAVDRWQQFWTQMAKDLLGGR